MYNKKTLSQVISHESVCIRRDLPVNSRYKYNLGTKWLLLPKRLTRF